MQLCHIILIILDMENVSKIQNGTFVVMTADDLREFSENLICLLLEKQKKQAKKLSDDKLLSPDEVADSYHVSKPTLWRWAKAGYLVPIRFGGLRRYRKGDVDRIMEQRMSEKAI
jgi:excisionase family DNA binding protein